MKSTEMVCVPSALACISAPFQFLIVHRMQPLMSELISPINGMVIEIYEEDFSF